jgi:hypothetical protein
VRCCQVADFHRTKPLLSSHYDTCPTCALYPPPITTLERSLGNPSALHSDDSETEIAAKKRRFICGVTSIRSANTFSQAASKDQA